MVDTEIDKKVLCSHCGDVCMDDTIGSAEHLFCCSGCEIVFQLLHDNGMGDYYRFDKTPGVSRRLSTLKSFNYLDNEDIIDKLLEFNEGGISVISFLIPQIHCSSCLWLLEHLSSMDCGITKSSVNFISKKVTVTFRKHETTLRSIVELLSRIGYEPSLNYSELDKKKSIRAFDKKLIYKLGLAGFSFGNIMLLSFPEYLGFEKASNHFYIGYMNILLAIPVLCYSGIDYLKSAFRGIKRNDYNIDLPIALGMIALFGRSIYEILSGYGEGYLDSFSGFIFFLLIGRWFQEFSYRALDFDRDYKSYFPISGTVKEGREWISRSIDKIVPGDILQIKNLELIPVDSILQKGKARVDYSFVTGESDLISKSKGEEVFAGGRHRGKSIEVEVTKSVDQSYLTKLWNDDIFNKETLSKSGIALSIISKYFTFFVILVATLSFLYWSTMDLQKAFTTFTSVLIVACPCALALAIPFTYGNILRLLSTRGFFLRNVDTIKRIQDIDYIVFDKTGTITDSNKIEVSYRGKSLTDLQKSYIKSLCNHSSHPLSKAIVKELDVGIYNDLQAFQETVGRGISGVCNGLTIKIGSSTYIASSGKREKEEGVFIEIENIYMGVFKFEHELRRNVKNVISELGNQNPIEVLSGDSDKEYTRIRSLVGQESIILFNQSPKDKLRRIKTLQSEGYRVMMLGDGLNDAGALKQANVGLVISDASNNFSPACDGIISAEEFSRLSVYIRYLRNAKYIIYGSFLLAFFYNAIGMCIAVSGNLSPVVAAILMPLSSITVIVYGLTVSWFLFRGINNRTQ